MIGRIFDGNEDTKLKSNEIVLNKLSEKNTNMEKIKNINEMEDDNNSDTSVASGDTNSIEDEADSSKKGLANVMATILKKETVKKVILAKSKTDKEITLEKIKRKRTIGLQEETSTENGTVSFSTKRRKVKGEDLSSSDDNDDIQHDPEVKRIKNIKKKAWEEMGRLKPDVLEKEKERTLQRVATKGVVQLFNAVKQQQKIISDKIEEAGPSETKRDKAIKSISKGQFMDMLKGTKGNVVAEGKPESIQKNKNKIKDVQKEIPASKKSTKEKPSWSILQDDFMMGAKMKDWDKESEEDMDMQNNSDSDYDQT